MSSMASLHSILDKNTTDRYCIEYNGFFSNHLTHGMIALHHLGCSPSRIDRFLKWYTPRLEDPDLDETDSKTFEQLRGERVSFYTIVKHYKDLLGSKYKNIDELIRGELPKISMGLGGSALHGPIHLGYGYSVKNERLVLEGLAYIYHSNKPIIAKNFVPVETFGRGSANVTDVLANIAKDDEMREAMIEAMEQPQWTSLKVGGFQKRVAFLLTIQGDKLVDYIRTLNIPADIRDDNGGIDTMKLARLVVQWTVTVYALSERKNDFLLLHGVTGAWSLMQIVPVLQHKDGVKILQEFLIVLLAVYVAQHAPGLTVPPEDLDTSPECWTDIVNKAIGEDRDEHCYKLVQVCIEMAKESRDGGSIYMQAAKSVLENKEFLYSY